MADRISSLDDGYQTGDLSVFPLAIDDRQTMYEATNNAQVLLKQTLTYNGKLIVVESTAGFPDNGELRIGPPPGVAGEFEMVAYGKKTDTTFQQLKRGFSGSKQNIWYAGRAYVSNAVAAEHHNAIKDAIINIENDLGVREFTEPASLNGILKKQEVRFLAPKPLFRAFPIKGPPPHTVRFQNFSTGHVVRFLWDFGDGGTSLERHPIHTYLTEGKFTVKLNIITSTGAQGIATKRDYIEVNKDESLPFFYVDSTDNPYSVETAAALSAGTYPPDFTPTPTDPKEFWFVDQTDGDVVQRNWIFGDGNTYTEQDPDVHDITHVYSVPGTYNVSMLAIFNNGRLKRVELPEPLIVF